MLSHNLGNIINTYGSIENLADQESDYEGNNTEGEKSRLFQVGAIFLTVIVSLVLVSLTKVEYLSTGVVKHITSEELATEDLAFFKQYLLSVNKSCDFDSCIDRFIIFQANLKAAEKLNEVEMLASGSALHGITKFSWMNSRDFKRTYLNSRPDIVVDQNKNYLTSNKILTAPLYVNWVGTYTTAIKDQGICGNCWAFSVVEQIESDCIRLLGINKFSSLSTEQVTDCDNLDNGCNGGWVGTAYSYVQSNGLQYESTYPETAPVTGTNGTCAANVTKMIVTISGFSFMNDGDPSLCNRTEVAMVAYVQQVGPLSVLIDATSLDSYINGTITVCGTNVNHAVQVVGVDIANGYWIVSLHRLSPQSFLYQSLCRFLIMLLLSFNQVRNSWGINWGMNGYVRLKLYNNTCGIALYPSYSIPKSYTAIPTSIPTRKPTRAPSSKPTSKPSLRPSGMPTRVPSAFPSFSPTKVPVPPLQTSDDEDHFPAPSA